MWQGESQVWWPKFMQWALYLQLNKTVMKTKIENDGDDTMKRTYCLIISGINANNNNVLKGKQSLLMVYEISCTLLHQRFDSLNKSHHQDELQRIHGTIK